MSETERKARYERAKERRRKRWAEMQAKLPPVEVSVYGIGSMLGLSVFGIWSMVASSVFANVATACCVIVWAGAVVVSWRMENRQ